MDTLITSWSTMGTAIDNLDSIEGVTIGVERKDSGTVEYMVVDLRMDITQLGISNFTSNGANTGNSGAVVGSVFGKTVDVLQSNDVITSLKI